MRAPVVLVIALSIGCGSSFSAQSGSGGGPAGGSAGAGAGSGGHAAEGGAGGAIPITWVATGHAFRKRITVGALGLASDLTSFPVAVLIDDDADVRAAAQPDGRDLLFTDADALTQLPHELELYDNGRVVAWVLAPVVAALGDTTLFMYYGTSDDQRWDDPAATWASAVSVWHLGDDPDASPPVFRDSRSSHDGAVPSPSATPARVAGIAGHGLSFDAIDDTVKIAEPADGSLDFAASSFSYSIWLKKTDSASLSIVFRKSGTCGGCTGYGIVAGPSNWRASLEDDGGHSANLAFGASAALLGGWTHLAAVVNRDSDRVVTYANGSVASELDISGWGGFSNNSDLDMGVPASWPLDGELDEVRVYPHAVTRDWLIAEHALLSAQATHVTLGPEQAAP